MRLDLDSEYQKRLDAYARKLVAETQPDWTPPADAAAVFQYDPGWCGTDVTPGDDPSLTLTLANRWVRVFHLSDLPEILRGLFEAEP